MTCRLADVFDWAFVPYLFWIWAIYIFLYLNEGIILFYFCNIIKFLFIYLKKLQIRRMISTIIVLCPPCWLRDICHFKYNFIIQNFNFWFQCPIKFRFKFTFSLYYFLIRVVLLQMMLITFLIKKIQN